MLFRPTFCAHCGEKIERAEWRPWTSRRFCPVCESEFKGQDLIPRAVVALGILVGIFGVGSYMKSGSASDLRAARQSQRFVEKQNGPAPVANVDHGVPSPAPAQLSRPPVSEDQKSIPPANTAPTTQTFSKPKVEQAEPVYFCGAETKKGTPCSRRVKGNTRCFQHIGMPAMLTADKLRLR
ncbi:MAG: hypothetical protein ABIV21_05550 [Pyrinomonadaceae bacterium]